MGIATFNGRHNRRRACILFVLYRYEVIFTSGKGLTSTDLMELVGLKAANTCEALGRLSKWHYVKMALTPPGTRRMRNYTLSAKGSTWLHRWAALIPWERYGWTEETIAETDRKIKEIVDFRGYK